MIIYIYIYYYLHCIHFIHIYTNIYHIYYLTLYTPQTGNVQLSLRDKNGGLQGGFRLHYGDLDLAVPPKRERVMVLTGKDQYKTGVVSVSSVYICIVFYFLYCLYNLHVLYIYIYKYVY